MLTLPIARITSYGRRKSICYQAAKIFNLFSENMRGRKKKRTFSILVFILLDEKFLQFDWLRAVVFQVNLKYLHVKITNLFNVVV